MEVKKAYCGNLNQQTAILPLCIIISPPQKNVLVWNNKRT